MQSDNTIAVVMVIAKRADNEVYELALARVRLHPDASIRDLAVPLESILRR